jgi:hypothetical protein
VDISERYIAPIFIRRQAASDYQKIQRRRVLISKAAGYEAFVSSSDPEPPIKLSGAEPAQ